MELIVCPECGNNVSDKAKTCIYCGFPISEFLEKEEEEKIRNEKYVCKVCGFQNKIGSNCSYFQEQNIEVGKARYSYNLNPFRIFTFANKKQKKKIIQYLKFVATIVARYLIKLSGICFGRCLFVNSCCFTHFTIEAC